MPERFAIYYAPPTASALWQRAGMWLGRDAASADAAPGVVPGLDPEKRHAVTESARRYGFHATLKPPFALASGTSRERLEEALGHFAANHRPVPIGRLVIKALDGFLALVPDVQGDALTTFAGDCVAAFEPFRAPISPAERERRIGAGLSADQIGLLDRYGYPYVMDQFQFHMTLTDRLTPTDAEAVTAAAEAWFAPVLGDDFILDRLSLFHEPEASAPFRRVADFPLSTKVPL